MEKIILVVVLLRLLLPSLSLNPSTPDRALLSLAFDSVAGFVLPNCSVQSAPLLELRLPSRRLSGTVSWMHLRNLTSLRVLDLSGNALEGSIPGAFWSSPSLTAVNLAGNRLGGSLRVDKSSSLSLRELNVSGNRLTAVVGLRQLAGLKVLDLSKNSISGNFPVDFPPIAGIRVLNVSFNDLTGLVEAKALEKFGNSAFRDAGNLTFSSSSSRSPLQHQRRHKNKKKVIKLAALISSASVLLIALSLVSIFLLLRTKRRRRRRPPEKKMNVEEQAAETAWVAEARRSAPVVVFEKPLLELTFSDLTTATSGFARESQLAEGRQSGTLYRAVLPGDMHVVVRVSSNFKGVNDEIQATAALRDLARLRHPNLLSLLGYCIAGKENILLLYEYMERGDMHRWLHELPAAPPAPEGEEDMWQPCDWPGRHRVALGVARGLAFLHQGWAGSGRPVVHGHLVPANVLLDDELEPRIADVGVTGEAVGSPEDDVYSFGLLILELVTGRTGWSEAEVEWTRGMVKAGKEAEAVDRRLMSSEWEKETAECMRVGYLCTARSAEKRPTMQQVVGLMKDIRGSGSSRA